MHVLPSGQGWRQPAKAKGQLRCLPQVRRKGSKQLVTLTATIWPMVPWPSRSTAVKPALNKSVVGCKGGTIKGRHSAMFSEQHHPPAGSPVLLTLLPSLLSTRRRPEVACCLTVGASPNRPATRKAVVEATTICTIAALSGNPIVPRAM